MFVDRFQHTFDIGVLVFVEFAHFATVAALAEGGEFGGGEKFCGEGVGVVWGVGGEEEGVGDGGEFEVGVVAAGVDRGDGRGDGRHGRGGEEDGHRGGGKVFLSWLVI